MKKTFSIALFLSLSVAAQAAEQSQTFIRYANGAVQTLAGAPADYNVAPAGAAANVVKNAGMLYDKGVLSNPIAMMGGNYAFTTDGSLVTTSEIGFLYSGKSTYSPAAIGGNYFINKADRQVIAIDSSGCSIPTGAVANNVRLMGGNFYIDQSGVLTTIKHMGVNAANVSTPCAISGVITKKIGMGDFSGVTKAGGNFFFKSDGTLVGIASDTGFFTAPQTVSSKPKQIGGNYFVAEDKTLYTVNDQGLVTKLNPVIGTIKTYGYSYLIADDGYFIFVDGKGIAHTDLVNVSSSGAGKLVDQIKGTLSAPPSFIPSQQ